MPCSRPCGGARQACSKPHARARSRGARAVKIFCAYGVWTVKRSGTQCMAGAGQLFQSRGPFSCWAESYDPDRRSRACTGKPLRVLAWSQWSLDGGQVRSRHAGGRVCLILRKVSAQARRCLVRLVPPAPGGCVRKPRAPATPGFRARLWASNLIPTVWMKGA